MNHRQRLIKDAQLRDGRVYPLLIDSIQPYPQLYRHKFNGSVRTFWFVNGAWNCSVFEDSNPNYDSKSKRIVAKTPNHFESWLQNAEPAGTLA